MSTKQQPCECAARKAIEEVIQTTQPIAIAFAARAMQGDDILVNVPFSAIRETAYLCGRLAKPKEGDSLSAPCPCDALREENERLKELIGRWKREEEYWKEDEIRLTAERDEATRTRTLAQEASTRDLEAKRAAELQACILHTTNIKLRADLTEALEIVGQVLDLTGDEATAYGINQDCTASVLAKHREAK